jgi:hypothetical protein
MSEESYASRQTIPARIETIDNWHRKWDAVLGMISRLNGADCLMLDEDGWLSARQVLLVAFVGGAPVGYLCFRVQPQERNGIILLDGGKPILEATVVGQDVDADYDRKRISRQLLEAAMNRALELRCRRFQGKTAVDVQ